MPRLLPKNIRYPETKQNSIYLKISLLINTFQFNTSLKIVRFLKSIVFFATVKETFIFYGKITYKKIKLIQNALILNSVMKWHNVVKDYHHTKPKIMWLNKINPLLLFIWKRWIKAKRNRFNRTLPEEHWENIHCARPNKKLFLVLIH